MNTLRIIKNHVKEWDWDCEELVDCLNNYYYEYLNNTKHVEIANNKMFLWERGVCSKLTKANLYKEAVKAINDLKSKMSIKRAFEYFNIEDYKEFDYED